MPRSTQFPQKIDQNPQLPDAGVIFSPLRLDPGFPLEIVLNGERDDAPITQLHLHDGFELGICLGGSGTFYVGSKILPFHEGNITVLTDREFHRCRSNMGTRSTWAWFFFEPVRLLVPHAASRITWDPGRFSGADFNNVLRPEDYPAISMYVNRLLAESSRVDDVSSENLRALLLLIVNELHRTVPAKEGDRNEPDLDARSLARITPALERISQSFHEPLTIPHLAFECSMSVRNFQLQFTRLIGSSPQQYLLKSRVQAAAALLLDRRTTITDVAYQCGFQSLSSFHRAFKALHQISPRAFQALQGH